MILVTVVNKHGTGTFVLLCYVMGKEKELLEAVRTKNVEQARKIVSKLKKTGERVL